MKQLFITATGTNVGKTYTTIALVELFAKRGVAVGVCKPVETGVIDDNAQDATALLGTVQRLNKSFELLSPKEITAYTFELPAAPFSADKEKIIDVDKIVEKIDMLSQKCELLIIEGAGGLMVPITQDFMMIDLIEKLDAKTLLVTPSRLGSINDTLLSMAMLHSRELSFDWCVNIHEDKEGFNEANRPYYDAKFPHWWSVEEGLEQFVDRYISENF